MAARAKKEPSFEENLERLQELVAQMEDSETPIDRTVELYREGVALSLSLQKKLGAYEDEISLLSRTLSGDFIETSEGGNADE